jgi:hypothetical protein
MHERTFTRLPHCEFAVPDYGTPAGVSDCGEPAVYKVEWSVSEEDASGCLYVCEKHAQEIEANELQEEEQCN